MEDLNHQNLYQTFNNDLLSAIFTSIRNNWAKMVEFYRSIKIINLFKIFAMIIFIHQTILLTINYLNFETMIDLKIIEAMRVNNFERHPAISLCLKSSPFYHKNISKTTVRDNFGQIICKSGNCMTINFNFFNALSVGAENSRKIDIKKFSLKKIALSLKMNEFK